MEKEYGPQKQEMQAYLSKSKQPVLTYPDATVTAYIWTIVTATATSQKATNGCGAIRHHIAAESIGQE
jgi:hypothetical protein